MFARILVGSDGVAFMYRYRLVIQHNVKSYGNPGPWEDLAGAPGVYCKFIRASGREVGSDSGVATVTTHRIEARYNSFLNHEHRLYDPVTGKKYEVVFVDDQTRKKCVMLVDLVERNDE